MAHEEKSYKGIGGWLILPLIGLFVTPIKVFASVFKDLISIFPEGYWDMLTNPASELYHPLWAPLIIFELIGNGVVMLFAIFLLVFFFGKSRLFPKLMIAFLIFNLLFSVGDFILVDFIPAIAEQLDPWAVKELTIAILGALIWIPYFFVSNRVRQTFKN